MTALVVGTIAGLGMYLTYTATAFRWRHVGVRTRFRSGPGRPGPTRTWLVQAGLADLRPRDFILVVVAIFVAGSLVGFVLFGGIIASVAIGLFCSTLPPAAYRRRRETRQAVANEAWPRLIDEIRILTSSAGRAIPQALFDAGRRGPEALRPAFAAAEREWLLTTDFERTLAMLKARLADPTADAACETLLIAYEIGGGDLDSRLAALSEDRRLDVQGRKDARARQASVRFARNFVLIVPAGMAVAGMSVGTGREAYTTPQGQILVVAGIVVVVGCWLWAGRLMRLPQTERVFPD